jgi:hypothetical protein
VRGALADLLDNPQLPAPARTAIVQASAFDAGVRETLSDFFASRRNYDVIQGLDREGRTVSGVLEQSWRIGGASPAEIIALEAFKAEPQLRSVSASVREIYAAVAPMPPGAQVLFHGEDAHVGWLLKYCIIDARGEQG